MGGDEMKAENGNNSPEKGDQMEIRKEEGEAAKEGKRSEVDEMNENKKIKEAESKNKKENGEKEKETEDGQSEKMEEPLAREESALVKKNEDDVKTEDETKVEGGVVEENMEKEPKKRQRGKSSAEKNKDKKELEQRTPATDRPVRERKSVERLVASIEKDTVKEFKIEKGRGTPLKEIPNVAFKLSRRKTDDTFKLLHNILFGRRGKAFQIKSNISRFSGFVWHANEEKQKSKVKEKFDKFNKEKLVEFCDVLDVPVAKSSTRKEDIVAKLVDFLIAPHATTTVLLAEKEKSNKGSKRKRTVKGGSSSSGIVNSAKSRKMSGSSIKEINAPETESESEGEEVEDEENEQGSENGGEEKSEDEAAKNLEGEEGTESEEESDEHAGRGKDNKKSPLNKKESAGKAKTKDAVDVKKDKPSKKTPIKSSSSKLSKGDVDNVKTPKVSSGKKRNAEVVKEKKSSTPKKLKLSAPEKSASKEKAAKISGKGNGKAKMKKSSKPTDNELRDAIIELLKEVDITKATFTDILKQLAERFNTDIMARKQSIKVMIQEELTKIAEDDEEEDEDGADASEDGRIEETKGTGHGVKA